LRILLDTCVWGGTRRELVALGHDVVWAGDWSEDPGDDEILALAVRERRVLVTLDKDFGELAILRRQPHTGIIRLAGIRSIEQAPYAQRVLVLHQTELEAGALVTVEPGRIRIRPAE